MTQLEEIQQFIQSPAFNILTDKAKEELRLLESENTAIISDIAFDCMSNPIRRQILRDSLLWMIKNETLPHSPRLYSINDDAPKMAAERAKTIIPFVTTAFMALLA